MPSAPGFPSAPSFSQRVPVQFVCRDQQSLSITPANGNLLLNNPAIFTVQSGTVAKLDMGLDGLNYLRGDGEYAPTLSLEWKQIGLTDYLKLAQLRPYYCTFVSYRNVGYYGKLILPGPQSAGTKTADVLACKATFMTLAPSDDGGAQPISRISTPTDFAVQNITTANSGYLTVAPNYYWLTFSSRYGETYPQAFGAGNNTGEDAGTPVTGAANTHNLISWTWPTYTSKIDAAYIYVSNSNDHNSARLIGSVPYGLAPSWVDYVGYQGSLVNQQPPTLNSAFRGEWFGGIWFNENDVAPVVSTVTLVRETAFNGTSDVRVNFKLTGAVAPAIGSLVLVGYVLSPKILHTNVTNTMSVASGWTKVNDINSAQIAPDTYSRAGINVGFACRVWEAGDTETWATTPIASGDGGGNHGMCVAYEIIGYNATTPINVSSAAYTYPITSTTFGSLAITPTAQKAMVFAAFGSSNADSGVSPLSIAQSEWVLDEYTEVSGGDIATSATFAHRTALSLDTTTPISVTLTLDSSFNDGTQSMGMCLVAINSAT